MEMKITFSGGQRVDASFEGFTVETDQSAKLGGEGSRPEPFAYFLASIGTCAGIYVLVFCQKRNIPTEGIELVQTSVRDEKTHALVRVDIQIRVPESFPEKYRTALARAAESCAVKKAIQSPPEFTVETVVG